MLETNQKYDIKYDKYDSDNFLRIVELFKRSLTLVGCVHWSTQQNLYSDLWYNI